MRIVLEIASGTETGRKVQLGAGQQLRVGRTHWADLAVETDGHMSGVHFALETDDVACYVSDQGSSNGTLLNDEPVGERTVVRDGDTILAGETQFILHVEGDKPEKTAGAGKLGDSSVGFAGLKTALSQVQANYEVETCDSGLTVCRGDVAEIEASDLTVLLTRHMPAFLIVDLQKLDTPPEDLASPDYLFDWLPPEAAALASPVLVAPEDVPEWPKLVAAGWGNEAVVTLFSRMEKAALLAHLRRALRAKPGREDASGGIIGFCWPGVMAMLLAHQTASFVERLLQGIDAVLVELPDLPERWQLFGQSSIADLLDEAGLVRRTEEQVPEENEQPPGEGE
ncbi:MAG: FHA domain-containing protein [Planctomycetes bacterium]|nr:FHA domain-containing protein [Planctomycetota bacterium]